MENNKTQHTDSTENAETRNPSSGHTRHLREDAQSQTHDLNDKIEEVGNRIVHEAEREKQRLRKNANSRVSHICVVAALIISAISLGSVALGHADMQNVLVGQLISVMLICVAYLQDHHSNRSN